MANNLEPNGSAKKYQLRRKSGSRNYDEHLMDELMDTHLGVSGKKRNRTKKDLEKETETEAMLALSLGFPIDDLLEEEIQAGVVSEVGGKEQNDYIVVRNHILARWRSNVRLWLSKDQIRETVSNEYEHLLCTAYDFLFYNGYINFGLLNSLNSHIPEESVGVSVIVVGSGLAGLAAARQLMTFGYKVIVLEARNRSGGRVYTQNIGTNGQFAAADLGGSVITGIHANPLGVLARQLGIPLHNVRDACPLYKPNGEPVDSEIDSEIEFNFNKLLDKVSELRKRMGGFATNISLGSLLDTLVEFYNVAKTDEEIHLLNWHLANLEYANAGCLSDLSAAYWDQDDPFEMGGDHCFLAGGNWRLVKALCEGIPIFYGKTVDTIRYGDEVGVEVIAGDQVFQADVVLCTVPLGLLKKKVIKFEPELPERKLAAIERLGFGLLNKIAMLFPNVFWGEELDTFGSLNEHSNNRGEFFLFYANHTVSGGPVLMALVAGEASKTFEMADPSVLLSRVLIVLRGIYTRKGIEVPNPIETICTRWGNDPFSFGAYSHVTVKSSGKDYDILAENVNRRLFFAGEATTRKYPATMHGAFLSGLREASSILKATTEGQDKNNSKKYGQRKAKTATKDILSNLFDWPDLEFGKFTFIDPYSSDPTSVGLLRITFSNHIEDSIKEREQSCQLPPHLYALLTCEEVHKLQLITGGDETRLTYLTKDLGLSLVGFDAVRDAATSIAAARKRRGRRR